MRGVWVFRPWRAEGAAWGAGACLAVGLVLGGLLVGYEPVGGDPDRIYRPIKAELAGALGEGRLPFWSDRLGLGVPLLAESHAGALYPPNWGLYTALGAPAAYRLSMWLHHVGLAAATFAYARAVGIKPAGASLAAVAFPLCGFLTVQSSHEWAYGALAYLPVCLLAADRYAATGRAGWLGALGLLWGVQITLGHFQIQTWTGGLAVLTGAWRVLADGRPRRRLVGLAVGAAWGLAVASAQLVPTWELARLVGQTDRSFAELAFYSYPPSHWAELAVPGLYRFLAGGPEGAYWMAEQTTRYEACLFVGTAPLVLAFVGLVGGGRGLTPWRLIVPAALALATMPRWWPGGYAWLIEVPGLGYFRAPARYTAVATFGLALLAGRGLDGAIGAARFRAGVALAVLFGAAAIALAAFGPSWNPRLAAELPQGAQWVALGAAAGSWAVALGLVAGWRRGGLGGAWLVAFTAVEMGLWYHLGTTTVWGWSVPLPAASPVLTRLAGDPDVRRVGGVLDDLPLRAGLTSAAAYTGFPMPPPNTLLKTLGDRRLAGDPSALAYLRRYGVTHAVWDVPSVGDELARLSDPALDALAYRPPGLPERRSWRVVAVRDPFPEARVVRETVVVPDRRALTGALAADADPGRAYVLAADAPQPPAAPAARSARLVDWRGREGTVEHDGSCDLVLTRAYYPGWTARVNGGPPRPVFPADDGLTAVRLDGRGTSRVALEYRPNHFTAAALVSAVATLAALAVIGRDLRPSA